MMKLVSFLLVGVICGCASDVSNTKPHSNLIGTTWKLKVDAYIIEYDDDRNNHRILPCSPSQYSGNFPDAKFEFKEANVGLHYNGTSIVGGLHKGTVLTIIRVTKDVHPEIGARFYPIATVERIDGEVGGGELNARLLYRGYHDKGILNPEYVDLIDRAIERKLNPKPITD